MRVLSRAGGRDSCGRYPSHPHFGNPQCSIGTGGSVYVTPTGGSTQVIEDTGKRLKLKKIPKLPDMGKLSDVAIVLLVLKTLDNFAPAFPADGFGMTEYHANEQPSGRGYVLMDSIQFDAYKASNKFADIIFPILIGISTRPSITKMQGESTNAKEDVMKFIYSYSGGGIPGKRYLNTKYVFDFLNEKFGQLRQGISEVEKNVSAFNKIRESYNAKDSVDAQTLAMWSDATSAEYAAIESLLALSKDSSSIMDVVAKAVVAIGSQKAADKIEEAKKNASESIKNFFKMGAKAAPQIDKQSNAFQKGLMSFQKSFVAAQPQGGKTVQFISIPTGSALAGLGVDFGDVSGGIFKVAAAGVIGYAIAKRKPLIGILGGVLAAAAFGDVLFGKSSPVAAQPVPAPQPQRVVPVYRQVVYFPPPPPKTIQTLSDDLCDYGYND